VTRVWSTVLLLAALVSAGCAHDPQRQAAVAAVEGLYAELAAHPVSGAPSTEELDALTPWLGEELERLLVQARAVHDLERERAPGEKPPFNDGDLFSSLFEGPTAFDVGPARADGRTWLVPVMFTHGAPGGSTDWTDTVIVANEAGGWVVVDLIYGGDWDFAIQGRLVANLRSGLADHAAPTP
jgi:hypothetical protein